MRIVIRDYSSRTYLAPGINPAKHKIIFYNVTGYVRTYGESKISITSINGVVKYQSVNRWTRDRVVARILNATFAICDDIVANRNPV